MSKGSNFMSFLSGAVFGAIIALLYAPTSGEELRGNIREEVDARWQQASEEWDKTMESIQASIEEMSEEFKAYFEQLSTSDKEKVELVNEIPDVVTGEEEIEQGS